VKVTDFGIAKMMAMGMTQAGQILGTPNYMSPEQVKGRQIDGRSDIFSLGVILYELVTGEKPFGGQNITTVIYKIINENPIPPRELDGSIHAGLSYVISKALAKKPDERYQTCRELAEDLRNYKNLAGAAVGQGTMVFNAAPASMEVAEPALPQPIQMPPPPAPPPQSVPTTVEETPIGSPLNIDAIPPHAPRQQSIPQIAWVLGALFVVAIMGGISYFVAIRPRSKPITRVVAPTVVTEPPAQNAQPPVTPTAQAGALATATTAPVTSATPPPTEVPETSHQEHPARTAAAKGGQLMVSANVNGAKIFVDGRSDPSWVTPYTIADLPAGAHNVEISMDGYDNSEQSVMVESGQTVNVVGNLSAPRAEFGITTKPPGVEVLIDGKSYGPSPVHATLAPGNHTYTVKQPGAAPYENTVTLKSGEIISKTITLGTAVATGIVEVRTIPPGATVMADGALVGGQTPTSFRLSVGTHALVISLSGYAPIRQQVTASESETTAVNASLTSQ
jgi:serine/threonine-protein kinase